MRLVSNGRYEEMRCIAAELIEDYAIIYPFDPLTLAKHFKVEIHSYASDKLLNALGWRACFCEGGFSARFHNAGKITYQIAIEEKTGEERKKFTIAHELSHIVLDHFGDNRRNEELEQEANFLASFLIMPEIIGNCIFENNSVEEIKDFCKVSDECARNISIRLNRRGVSLTDLNYYEKKILKCVDVQALKVLNTFLAVRRANAKTNVTLP